MSKEEKQRPRVDNLDMCSTPADVGEYLEDNPFHEIVSEPGQPHSILEHALYKSEKPNITQYQLKLQSVEAPPRAYAVLLRIMEIRFGLERLDL